MGNIFMSCRHHETSMVTVRGNLDLCTATALIWWPICHWLGLGHERMVCAVCLSTFLPVYVEGIKPYLKDSNVSEILGSPIFNCFCFEFVWFHQICVLRSMIFWDYFFIRVYSKNEIPTKSQHFWDESMSLARHHSGEWSNDTLASGIFYPKQVMFIINYT